jgi:hypothetical protein
MKVVGVYGCTCSGKSTFAHVLADSCAPSRVIEVDTFRWPEAEYACRGVEPLDLSNLPWKAPTSGTTAGETATVVPGPLDKRFDTNSPAWVDWEAAYIVRICICCDRSV